MTTATSNVFDLAAHQAALGQQADEIIGLAMQLRSRLRTAVSAPLPDKATDDLILALAVFVAEARRCER